jgi:trimethylamine:corrinoid methyltransferase-like protein
MNYFEDIAAVKHGGNFLARPNTRSASRSREFVTPELCDRSTLDQWVALGCPDLYTKARQKVEQILSSPPRNPLPDALVGKLEDIMRKADEVLKPA